MIGDYESVASRARQWLCEFLRRDSTNPPGNVTEVIELARNILSAEGITATVLDAAPGQSNLVAVWPGTDSAAAPLLLSSHADVVPSGDPLKWRYPPFAGAHAEGCIWGRGALDVKYKLVFDLAAIIEAKRCRWRRPIKLALVCDEERGGELGSAWLVRNHLQLINAANVINEVGGFTVPIGGVTAIPIQLGEKGSAVLRVVLTGPGGHGSMAPEQTALTAAGRVLTAVEKMRFDYAAPLLTRQFMQRIGAAQPGAAKLLFDALCDPRSFEGAISQITDPGLRAQLTAMFGRTVTPTCIRGGTSPNSIPAEVEITFDCRLMPGDAETVLLDPIREEIERALSGAGVRAEFDWEVSMRGYALDPAEPIFSQLERSVLECWSNKVAAPVVVPMLMPGSSDSSHYFSGGIQPVGFAPLLFQDDFPGFSLAHAVDERVPVAAFDEGLRCYLHALSALSR